MMSMNGSDVMPDTSELSEARRTLLEKYVRGDVPQIAVATRAVTQYAEADVATPRECVVTIQIRSEEHTSELQSPDHLVCRLLLEKKKTCHSINTTRNTS